MVIVESGDVEFVSALQVRAASKFGGSDTGKSRAAA
jgi:hypothetical protein